MLFLCFDCCDSLHDVTAVVNVDTGAVKKMLALSKVQAERRNHHGYYFREMSRLVGRLLRRNAEHYNCKLCGSV